MRDEIDGAVAVESRMGLPIYVNLEDERGQALQSESGVLNPSSTAIWQACLDLHPWDVIADVGANYGEMIANHDLSAFPNVMAFEPDPTVRGYLRKTIAQTPWNVELVEAAVGHKHTDKGELAVNLGWSGRTALSPYVNPLLASDQNLDVVPTRITTLDRAFEGKPYRSACIKIDVEGAELDVLAGARTTLEEYETVACMLEILHMPVEVIAQLARRYPFYLYNISQGRLVQFLGGDRDSLGRALHSGAFAKQDAVLLAGRGRQELAAIVRRTHSEGQSPSRVVYTALVGDYEDLQEQPVASSSEVSFICLTDDPSLTSETWDVRLIEPEFPMDAVRSARHLKILGHPIINTFPESLWVDNRVILQCDPDIIFDDLLGDCDIALLEHSFRDRLVDEFDAVAIGGYDDSARVYEQLLHYAESSPSVLDEKPLWTGFLIRRRNPATERVMQRWMSHVLRYSRRDQLSLLAALRQGDAEVKRLPGSNRETPYHVWPHLSESVRRKRGKGGTGFQHAVRAPLARLRSIERDHIDMVAAAQAAQEERAALVTSMAKKISDLEKQLHAVRTSGEKLKVELVEARAAYDRRTKQVEELQAAKEERAGVNAALKRKVSDLEEQLGAAHRAFDEYKERLPQGEAEDAHGTDEVAALREAQARLEARLKKSLAMQRRLRAQLRANAQSAKPPRDDGQKARHSGASRGSEASGSQSLLARALLRGRTRTVTVDTPGQET